MKPHIRLRQGLWRATWRMRLDPYDEVSVTLCEGPDFHDFCRVMRRGRETGAIPS